MPPVFIRLFLYKLLKIKGIFLRIGYNPSSNKIRLGLLNWENLQRRFYLCERSHLFQILKQIPPAKDSLKKKKKEIQCVDPDNGKNEGSVWFTLLPHLLCASTGDCIFLFRLPWWAILFPTDICSLLSHDPSSLSRWDDRRPGLPRNFSF